jgi:polyisoprenoid-binding protein YceI
MAVKSLGAAIAVTMLDDQKALMHVMPLDASGNPTSLPTGSKPPVYTASDATVTLDPTVDATGLSCEVIGVKTKAGTPTVTATFTNLDGTTAVGSAAFTITIDPLELDVSSLGVTVDTPVAQ